uniref:Uncharacterized protein n=1 Tax=viral metagenome TaxID=1070528 RepID=A0A6M3IW42_9ZZZZ
MGITIKSNIEFGKKYSSVTTGAEGIATAISKFQYGCIRVALQGKVKENGEVPDAVWLDEADVKEVKQLKKETGGPTPNPKQNLDPRQ